MYASLVIADGRLYAVGRSGTTVVLDTDKDMALLARNRLDDTFSASPAVAEDALFLRGEQSLYCLANKAP